jgi:hypothetical protein
MPTKDELKDFKDELLAMARRIDEVVDEIDDLIYGGIDHDGNE